MKNNRIKAAALLTLSFALNDLNAQVFPFEQIISIQDPTNSNRTQEFPHALEIIDVGGGMAEIYIGGGIRVPGNNASAEAMMLRTDQFGNLIDADMIGANNERDMGNSLQRSGFDPNIMLLGGLTDRQQTNNNNSAIIWSYDMAGGTFIPQANIYQSDDVGHIRSLKLRANDNHILATGPVSDNAIGGAREALYGDFNTTLGINVFNAYGTGSRRIYGNDLVQDNMQTMIVGYDENRSAILTVLDNILNATIMNEYFENSLSTPCEMRFKAIVQIQGTQEYLIVGHTIDCPLQADSGPNDGDAFVLRVDATGNILFAQLLGGGDIERGFSIRPSNQLAHRYYVVGNTESAGHGNSDFFVATYDLANGGNPEGFLNTQVKFFGDQNDDFLRGPNDMLEVSEDPSTQQEVVVVAGVTTNDVGEEDILLVSTLPTTPNSDDCGITGALNVITPNILIVQRAPLNGAVNNPLQLNDVLTNPNWNDEAFCRLSPDHKRASISQEGPALEPHINQNQLEVQSQKPTRFKVINTSGQVVLQGAHKQGINLYDVKGLPNGIYFYHDELNPSSIEKLTLFR